MQSSIVNAGYEPLIPMPFSPSTGITLVVFGVDVGVGTGLGVTSPPLQATRPSIIKMTAAIMMTFLIFIYSIFFYFGSSIVLSPFKHRA